MSNQRSIVVGYDSSIGPNDVLLGRGNHLHNSGNEKFRSLVRSRSIEYWSCNDNVMKDNIARQIVDAVTSQQGRFLRKMKKSSQGTDSDSAVVVARDSSGTSVPNEQWEVADIETVLVKIKQTFRDFTASNKRRTGVSAYKTYAPPSTDAPLNLQHMSILERLQNVSTLASPPFATLPDSNLSSRIISSPTTSKTDAYELLFQNARASQLDHLVHNAQQHLHNQNSQDRQLLSLFEQQRAILMTQLQQSSVTSSKKPQINQPAQHSQPYPSQCNPQPHRPMQAESSSLNQELMRFPNTALQFQQPLLNPQSHQSHQDLFLQRQNDSGQYQYLIDQQLRAFPRLDSSVIYHPQYALVNQNVPQNHIISSMNLNTVPNLQNWSLQPLPHNNLSISTGVQPSVQHQHHPLTQQNHIAERFNEYFNQGNIVPLDANNMTSMSSNVGIQELFAMSNQVHLPGAVTYHHPTVQQRVPTTDTAHPSASLRYEDDNNDDDKKPPAL